MPINNKMLTFYSLYKFFDYLCSMLRAYKYQLDPNTSQKQYFAKCFGATRWIYNRQLSKRVELYQKDKTRVSAVELTKEITILKQREEFEWLKEVPNQSLQQAIRNMDSAFTRFFREKTGFPKFRSKHKKQSFQFIENYTVDFEKSKVKIPKLGWVRAFVDRKFDGKLCTATISMNAAGKYFISVLVDDGKKLPESASIKESTSVGVDVGLKHFAVLSTGEKIDNPRYLENSLERLKVLQRRVSKKQKGSGRRKRASKRVAKLHYKISCQRKYFLHKLTSRIVRENQTVIVEDLNVSGMLKNHCLAKSISSASWSEFFRQLEYKASWAGGNLIRIGRFEPSSKMCTCGQINKGLKLSDREWTCKSCGSTHDRDLLAANNIKRFGLNNQVLIGTGKVIAAEDVEQPTLVGAMKR